MPKKTKPRSRTNTKIQSAIAQLSYLQQTFLLVWNAARNWTLAWFVMLVVQGLLPVATVYLTRIIVNSLVAVVGAGSSWDVKLIILPAAFMAGVLLLTEILRSASEWVRTAQSELVQDYISALIHQKSVAVDLAFYESSEYYDRLNRARSDASSRSLSLLENSGGLLQNSITLLALAAVLVPYGVWIPVLLVVSTSPAFYVVLRLNRRQHQWWEKTTPERRWLQYYEMLLTHSAVAAELRLFDLGAHFESAYRTLRHRLRNERFKLLKEQSIGRLTAGGIALVISGVAMLWMVRQVLLGLLTLGDLALFYQAFNQSQNLMRSLLVNLGQIYSNSLFLSNLFEFLGLEPQVLDPEKPLPVPLLKQGINFQQVTFRYPGSDRAALQDFNLTIPAGQVVAIVGDNGAGKSTLIKLLCRFYDPQSGAIELDGIDIRNCAIAQLRRIITVLFQSPITYHATAADNIALGDITAELSAAEIETAAKGAGAHDLIARLPRSYNTLLGKWFADGAELSGGEWQRVALARAFIRQAQIIVLDEPTSAMDSWAEADWLERFRTLANGRTAIVITHRFTLAMRADLIHVMRNGQIVESGSHEQLLAQGDLYAQSWTAQTQVSNYINELN